MSYEATEETAHGRCPRCGSPLPATGGECLYCGKTMAQPPGAVVHAIPLVFSSSSAVAYPTVYCTTAPCPLRKE